MILKVMCNKPIGSINRARTPVQQSSIEESSLPEAINTPFVFTCPLIINTWNGREVV